jgi:3'-5' exoribonuclease
VERVAARRLEKSPALHYIDNLDAKLEMLARGYESSAAVAERIYEKVRPLNVRPVAPLSPGA